MPSSARSFEGLIEKYFDETPAEVIVDRAERLRPAEHSECLGMLPEGAVVFDITKEILRRTDDGTPIHNCGLASHRECQCSKCCIGVCSACIEAI